MAAEQHACNARHRHACQNLVMLVRMCMLGHGARPVCICLSMQACSSLVASQILEAIPALVAVKDHTLQPRIEHVKPAASYIIRVHNV